MSVPRLRKAIASALLCCATAPALAELNANLGATTEFVREGISQNGGKITWQSGLTWQHHSGFYAGAWGSGLDRKYDSAHTEADLFAGFYQPLSEGVAVALSATHYRFYGDAVAEDQAYNELGARLLLNDSWVLGWRHSEDYMGTSLPRRALEVSYTLQRGSFAIEFFTAQYRFLEMAEGAGYSDGGRDDYWHFRVGVERTWNQWDYRLTIDRTNLSSRYDAGTTFQFGIHRYFNLW